MVDPFPISNELFFFIIEITMIGISMEFTFRILKRIQKDTAFNKFIAWNGACISGMIAAFHYGGLSWLTWSYFITTGILMYFGTKYYHLDKNRPELGVEGSAIMLAISALGHGGVVLAISIKLFILNSEPMIATALGVLAGILLALGATVAFFVRYKELKSSNP